ncbi:MAG: macro domain-containing protein [Thermoplasmata archaeon]|nr:MAG: macro domain-containing protein [Thermoplasmata archaeon]
MKIKVLKGDLTEIDADAIVNPANSLGYMGGGVAGAIKRKGGEEIEKEAVEKAPIPVGKAIATTPGRLKCRYVIHAPTMERPAMRISVDNVEKATRAALELAKDMGIKRIAFPGMGTGIGGVKEEDAAKAMIETIKEYLDFFDEIVLVDINDKMVNAWKKSVED